MKFLLIKKVKKPSSLMKTTFKVVDVVIAKTPDEAETLFKTSRRWSAYSKVVEETAWETLATNFWLSI